jgi:hypothetical protein
MFFKLIVATVSGSALPVDEQFKLFNKKETSDCLLFFASEIIYLLK